MESIKVDLIPGKQEPVCHASQYDVGRTIRVNLVENGAYYTLDGTETVTVEVRKPDGNFVTKSCSAVNGHTYVDVVTTQQMTAVAGMSLCNLKIVKGGTTIGTLNFILSVEPDPIDGASASESVIENLQAMVNAAVAASPYPAEVNNLKKYAQENFSNVYSSIGGDSIGLFWEPVDTMIGSDGTTKTATATNKFYSFDIPQGIESVSLVLAAAGQYITHWLNQYDENDNLLSYSTISSIDHTNTPITLESNCVRVVLSIFTDQGEFELTYSVNGTLASAVETNTTEILKIEGYSNKPLPLVDTNSMYDGAGNVRTPLSNMFMKEAKTTYGATSVRITFGANSSNGSHWWNEYDENGNVIVYETVYESTGILYIDKILNPQTKSIKLSIWNGNNSVAITGSLASPFLKKAEGVLYKKMSALGDSITAGYSQDETVTNTYQKLICDVLGIPYQNLGYSSTPICPNSDYSGGQNDHAFVYRYSQIDANSDLILVCGGTNDFRHNVPIGTASDTASDYESTFYGAVVYLINNIMLRCPYARLVFISPFHQINDTSANSAGFTIEDYLTALKDKFRQYGVQYIDAFAESGVSLRSDFITKCMPDSLHPNSKGHEIIFKNLFRYFSMI